VVSIGATPADAEEEPRRLDPRAMRVHEIGLIAFFGVLLSANLIAIAISALVNPRRWPLVVLNAAASLVIGGLLWWLAHTWARVSYQRTTWIHNARGLQIRRGVWWRHAITVPRSRIQHADVTQGPLQRAYELATLVLFTAGSQHARVELDGLAFPTALALREDLLRADRADSPAPTPPPAPVTDADDDDDALE
jgi:uncharacterized protein